nr:MAG TPA: hypothetical protein [Caudoviricetes sp.]
MPLSFMKQLYQYLHKRQQKRKNFLKSDLTSNKG